MTNTTPESAPKPKTGHSLLFWLSGGLVLLVIVAGVGIGVWTSMRNTDERASDPVYTPPPLEAVSSDSICGLADGDQSIPTTQAPDTTWELVGKMAAPAVEGVGPGKVDEDGFRSCFAHSPMGAVVAAANLGAHGSSVAHREKAYEYWLLDGPGKDAAIAALKAKPSPAVEVGGVQIVGFAVVSYDTDEALVEIAARNANGAIGVVPYELTWSNGDWRWSLQDNGQPRLTLKQVESLTGYLRWSGT